MILRTVVLIIPFLVLLSCVHSQVESISFDEQLKVFYDIGFELNDSVVESDLLEMWEKEQFEDDPFDLLYISFGYEVEKNTWIPISNNCWTFDAESIDGTGSYKEILLNLERISNGQLVFSSITDIVDWENEKASVSFEFDGEYHSWDLSFNYDWVDISLFSKIVALTEGSRNKGALAFYDTGGQSVVFSWLTKDEMEVIKKKTGLEIQWFK